MVVSSDNISKNAGSERRTIDLTATVPGSGGPLAAGAPAPDAGKPPRSRSFSNLFKRKGSSSSLAAEGDPAPAATGDR
jgi:hypothetical protein